VSLSLVKTFEAELENSWIALLAPPLALSIKPFKIKICFSQENLKVIFEKVFNKND